MKDAYYFPHDSNAHDDPKISKMFLAFESAVGYGIYWVIIEMLRNEKNYKLKTSDYDAIAYKSHSGVEQVEDVVCSYGLFSFDENNEYFWSESLLSRMMDVDIKREKAKASANIRWHGNANALRTQSDGNARKESKGKESNKDMFEQFYSKYPKKQAKALALKAFLKLSPSDDLFSKIMSAVNFWSTTEAWTKEGGKFVPMPSTWLNQERWNDQPIVVKNEWVKP